MSLFCHLQAFLSTRSLGILSSSTNESIIVSNFAQTGDSLSAENASDEFSPISGPTWVLKKCKPPLGPEHRQPGSVHLESSPVAFLRVQIERCSVQLQRHHGDRRQGT